jgi:hypothetical protein
MVLRFALASFLSVPLVGAALQACSAGEGTSFSRKGNGGSAGVDGSAGTINPGGSGGNNGDAPFTLDQSSPEACSPQCSNDFKAVVGCNGVVIQLCPEDQLCAGTSCKPACEAVKANKSSVGCDYYPVALSGFGGADTGCFAVFVANTWAKAAHVTVERNGAQLNAQGFGRIPTGTGSSLQYGTFDPAQGIPPGEVAIFFLQGSGGVPCPSGVAPATQGAQVNGNGIGQAFHVTTDVPVVAYQMLPYGGGSAAVTGASLLLPTSAWDTNYIAVNAYEASQAAGTSPTLNLVAAEDNTEITLLPKTNLQGGNGIPSGQANTPVTFTLNKGEHAQIVQPAELTGSPIESTKPIGMFAGHECLNVPANAPYCDHAEQQIPPVRALGFEYACVSYRQRSGVAENPPWRIIGAQPDTNLEFDPPSVHAAVTIQLGDLLEFNTAQPFSVKSQDEDHPFLVTTYMPGSTTVQEGYGDADFVRIVPPGQFLSRYVFFTDPTYPETNLVVIRKKDSKDQFQDVDLDCSGVLSGWAPIGDGKYEFTRTDLIRHDFQDQGGCSNGRHVMKSEGPFGLWVWGWGTPETSIFTENVSYSYPAGENVVPINTVYIPPTPK